MTIALRMRGGWRSGLCAGLLAVAPATAWAAEPARADFAAENASAATRRLADWVVRSGDSHGLPFLIVDKAGARVLAFDAQGRIRETAPVLLGLARGDVSPPGIGTAKLSAIGPDQRITPAGRFEAGFGRNPSGKDILWVDYDAAISLHRVVTSKPAEKRLQRLATASIGDNRISYGCINVPIAFYDGVVRPLFLPASGIVYILPEVRTLEAVFPAMGQAPPGAQ